MEAETPEIDFFWWKLPIMKFIRLLFGTPEQRAVRRKEKQQAEDNRRDYVWKFREDRIAAYRVAARNEISRWINDNSLTCANCHGLAAPIYATSNRYRCCSCSRQFSAAKHGYMSVHSQVIKSLPPIPKELWNEPLAAPEESVAFESGRDKLCAELYAEIIAAREANAE